MDAVEFLKEQARMCKSNEDCSGCPMRVLNCSDLMNDTQIEQKVEAVKKMEQRTSTGEIGTGRLRRRHSLYDGPQRTSSGWEETDTRLPYGQKRRSYPVSR